MAGVPQAQISWIESNSVDLRLSSLVAIGIALDLEIALAPRKAMPEIRSIMRQAADLPVIRPPAIGKEMQRLQKAIRTFEVKAPTLLELDQLRKAISSWPATRSAPCRSKRAVPDFGIAEFKRGNLAAAFRQTDCNRRPDLAFSLDRPGEFTAARSQT